MSNVEYTQNNNPNVSFAEPKIPEELLKEIAHLKLREVFLIGIDGCGGAGKSTYAKNLATALDNSQVIHVDDFYKPKNERIEITEQTPVHSNFEFDRLKHEVLEPLKGGTSPSYNNADGVSLEVKSEGYVIVEGLGTLGKELRDYFDYKIWIDSPEIVRRQRGIERDSEEWTKIWDDEYLPQDFRYVTEQNPQDEANWTLQN